MAKISVIINHLEGLTEEQITLVGTDGQVQLTKSETEREDIYEFYNTVELASAEKALWDS